jgi:hypothetical protein
VFSLIAFVSVVLWKRSGATTLREGLVSESGSDLIIRKVFFFTGSECSESSESSLSLSSWFFSLEVRAADGLPLLTFAAATGTLVFLAGRTGGDGRPVLILLAATLFLRLFDMLSFSSSSSSSSSTLILRTLDCDFGAFT